MTEAMQAARFETPTGEQLPLAGMKIIGSLRNGLATIELDQTWRNDSGENIEGVYTFPLPVTATVLELNVQLGDRTLRGTVASRAQAERDYEIAIAAGDSAVLLEQPEPGLFSLNVGNLMPSEQAIVRLRYALPLQREGDTTRLALPTTVAPRFGSAAEAGLQPHQIPSADALAEHRFTLRLSLQGGLAEARISSPSHVISVGRTGSTVEVDLADAPADRDFVLTLSESAAPRSVIEVARSGDGFVAHASIRVPAVTSRQAIALRVLVDCSGSMAGDSILLARACARQALLHLVPGDAFSVSAFGNCTEHDPQLHGRMLPFAKDSIRQAADIFVGGLDANLGGTELANALTDVMALGSTPDGPQAPGGEILLITDGESWDRDHIVRIAGGSGHRIFVIGIGSSPVEALVREIAEATGGAAAFLSPGEVAAGVVDRHLNRMRVPRVVDAALDLGVEIEWQTPGRLDRCLFAGDTLHIYMGTRALPAARASLRLRYADGSTAILEAETTCAPVGRESFDLIRMGAATRLREAAFSETPDKEALAALALEHGLMSPYTNYILVIRRGEDAATEMPKLQQVPHMLAAGWGGTGAVRRAPSITAMESSIQFSRRRIDKAGTGTSSSSAEPVMFRMMDQRMPCDLIDAMEKRFGLFTSPRELLKPIHADDGLGSFDLDEEMIEALTDLQLNGWPEDVVVAAFWLALERSAPGARFGRAHRRAVLALAREVSVPALLVDWITSALAGVTDTRWSWNPTSEPPVHGLHAEIR